MSDSEAITKLLKGLEATDKILARADRIGAAAKWLLGSMALAVLWVARVEWNHSNHEGRLASVEQDAKGLTRDVDRMKGSLGLTARPAEKAAPQNAYVWRPEDDCGDAEQATR